MLEIVLASTNKGKLGEFQEMLKGLPIKLIPQSELGIEEIEETGLTFVENAVLKARHAAKIAQLPAIADDSGLVVDALGDAPGIYSSRYAGPNANDADRIAKLLKAMQGIKADQRTANFHCVTVLLEHDSDPAPILCEGIWDGKILLEPRGNKGFGYDPVFYVPEYDCSAAELELDIKNSISHRGQAMQQLLEILSTGFA